MRESLSQYFDSFELLLESTLDFAIGLHPLIVGAFFVALGILKREHWAFLFSVLTPLIIYKLNLWDQMLETLLLVFIATFLSTFIGVPLGILAKRKPWVYKVMEPLLDLMQTIPTFVYLIPALMIFGLGMVPGIFATVVFAIPAPIRLTYLGLNGVPREILEMGRSFGASPKQLLFKIEIPYALPVILTGVSQCILLSLSMVVIAALVGAQGLGQEVVRALNTVDIQRGMESGLAIVLVAMTLDKLVKVKTHDAR